VSNSIILHSPLTKLPGLLTDFYKKDTRPDCILPPNNTKNYKISSINPNSAIVTRALLTGVVGVSGDYEHYRINRVTILSDRIQVLKATVTLQFSDFVLHNCVIKLVPAR
jgi:hypothetical protein